MCAVLLPAVSIVLREPSTRKFLAGDGEIRLLQDIAQNLHDSREKKAEHRVGEAPKAATQQSGWS